MEFRNSGPVVPNLFLHLWNSDAAHIILIIQKVEEAWKASINMI